MSEHQEQTALFNILRMYEDKYPELKWVHAIPNGGHRHISVARKMKAEGVKAGVWDLFVPVIKDEVKCHTFIGYCGLYVEMKVKPNKLTDNQKAFRDEVGDAYEWAVCYSAVEACHVIGEYLDIYELKGVE